MTAPIKLNFSLRPKNPEDEAKRAYFLCRQLESRYAFFLRSIIESAADESNDEDLDAAIDDCIKLLTWTSLYILGIRCGALEASPWILDFLACALRFADNFTGSEQTPFYLDEIKGLPEDPIVHKAACAVALKLRIVEKEFIDDTKATMRETSEEARELLQIALNESLDQLKEALRLLGV